MEKILLKKEFINWLKLLNTYKIYAPVNNAEVWNYELINNPEKINLDYPNSALSPKKILLPQREILFEYESSKEKKIDVKETLPEESPVIVFGVRPCDASGLNKIKKIFTGGFKDGYLSKRSELTTIVGLACTIPPSG